MAKFIKVMTVAGDPLDHQTSVNVDHIMCIEQTKAGCIITLVGDIRLVTVDDYRDMCGAIEALDEIDEEYCEDDELDRIRP